MKLPGAPEAVVDIDKLQLYCLNPSHPRGRHKARVFAASLGLTAADAVELRTALLRAALGTEAIPAVSDEYGERYLLDFEMTRARWRARIRSSWIVLRGESFPA